MINLLITFMKLSILIYNCDALRDLVPFIQFKKREKNMKEYYSTVFQIFKIAQMVPNRAYFTRTILSNSGEQFQPIISCIILKNGQIYLNILHVLTARLLKYDGHFLTLFMQELTRSCAHVHGSRTDL